MYDNKIKAAACADQTFDNGDRFLRSQYLLESEVYVVPNHLETVSTKHTFTCFFIRQFRGIISKCFDR